MSCYVHIRSVRSLTPHSVVLADEFEGVLRFLYYNASDADIARALRPANCSQAHARTYTHATHNQKRYITESTL